MILGLSGIKGSGKTTAARYLCEKHGFVEITLAETLKDICKAWLNLSNEQLYGNEKEVPCLEGKTPRQIMQHVGDMFRTGLSPLFPSWGEDVFIKSLKEKHKNLLADQSARIVISDIRRWNELNFVKEIGGTAIYIVPREDIITGDQHISETEMQHLQYDIKLDNRKDLGYFYSQLDELLKDKKKVVNSQHSQ